jgi:hypothetical protein
VKATAVLGKFPITQADLEEICAKWQHILRLRDWDVKIAFAHAYDIAANCSGDVAFVVAKKTATINILFEAEYHSSIKWPQDIEKTIVHELVHLHLGPVDHFDGLRERLLEQAVECLASALVDRDRAEKK